MSEWGSWKYTPDFDEWLYEFITGVAWEQTLTDIIYIGEVFGGQTLTKSLSDAITLTDGISTLAKYYRTLLDSIVPSDNLIKLTSKNFADFITLSDLLSLITKYAILLAEGITLSESIAKKDVAKRITDSITLLDTVSTLTKYLRLLQDTITLSDSISKQTAKKIADRILMTLWFIFQTAASSATSTAWTIETEDSETWTIETEKQTLLG